MSDVIAEENSSSSARGDGRHLATDGVPRRLKPAARGIPVTHGAAWRRTILGGLLALAAVGCAAPTRFHLVMLGSDRISDTEPLIVEVTPDECFYWLDDDGRLCLAMRRHDRSWRGRVHDYDFAASFVLDEPPADTGRNYPVKNRTFRSKTKSGYIHTRMFSRTGVVGVWNYGSDTLDGRFRFFARQQSYSVFVGWGGERYVLVVGEFSAKQDRTRGEAILQRTEVDELKREAPPPKPIPINGPPRSPS